MKCIRWTLLLACLSFALSGCASRSIQIVRKVRPTSWRTGYVDIGQIEAIDPRQPILAELNLASEINERFSQSELSNIDEAGSVGYLKKMAGLGNVNVGENVRETQRQNLIKVGNVMIGELDSRLLQSDQAQLDALRKARQEAADVEFQKSVESLQESASTAAASNKVDPATISSLKMQISATALNQNPPPSAPRGYWARIQATRQAKLDQLLKSYDESLAVIYSSRDKQIAAERVRVDQDVESSMETAEAAATLRRKKQLDVARQRFDAEQKALDTEDDDVINSAMLLASPDQTVTAAFEEKSGNADTPTGGSAAAVLVNRYRARLEASILADAYATVTSISKKLHLKIVREKEGVPDLTGTIVDAVRDRNWKIS